MVSVFGTEQIQKMQGIADIVNDLALTLVSRGTLDDDACNPRAAFIDGRKLIRRIGSKSYAASDFGPISFRSVAGIEQQLAPAICIRVTQKHEGDQIHTLMSRTHARGAWQRLE